MMTKQEGNIVVSMRVNDCLVPIKLKDMTKEHRTALQRKLIEYAAERKTGFQSLWYKTGKTIGELVAIIERANTGNTTCAKRKKVFVKAHYRNVR